MAGLENWIWFSTVGFSPRGRQTLLRHFDDPDEIWRSPMDAFRHLDGLSDRDRTLLERRDLAAVYPVLDACRAQGLRILTMQDAAYPESLRNIPDPPAVLYVKGELPALDLDPAIAVIGTRRASPYGLKMAGTLAAEIIDCGGIVLSGLTAGIDSAAVRGALYTGGRCIAVLGTAHEQENSSLARDVADYGAVISEYAPGTRSQRYFFRERNRITAGLSAGVLVVEAPEKSGALLFAQEALEQGKDIFAVPGNADAENSVGTLALLREGATVATCGWDVMSEYVSRFPGRIHPPKHVSIVPPTPRALPGDLDRMTNPPPEAPVSIRAAQPASLTEDQRAILEALASGCSHVDDLIDRTGLSAHTVLAQLTVLTIRGLVSRDGSGRVVPNT